MAENEWNPINVPLEVAKNNLVVGFMMFTALHSPNPEKQKALDRLNDLWHEVTVLLDEILPWEDPL